MSIDTETKKDIRPLEQPREIPRHTHNGTDSQKIPIRNITKVKLPEGTPYEGEYLYDSLPYFSGQVQGYPGSAPQITFQSVNIPDVGTIQIPTVDSVNMVNAWISETQEAFVQLVKRQQTLTRLMVANGLATYMQNPSSDAYDPLFTYFDR